MTNLLQFIESKRAHALTNRDVSKFMQLLNQASKENFPYSQLTPFLQ